MDLSEMLRKREIQKAEPDSKTALKLLAVSQDGLVAAEDNLKISHPDVALSLAYNSMLNAGRALMAAKGYRAYSETHHKSVVGFCAAVLPSESSQLVSLFNRYRMRRHDIVYGEIEGKSVSEGEAKSSIEKAKEFLVLIKSKIA